MRRKGKRTLLALSLLLLTGTASATCVTTSTSVTDPKTGEKETATQTTCWDDGLPGTGVGGGDWDSGGAPPIGGGGGWPQCDFLRSSKPQNCTGPADINGPRWGEGHYGVLTGLGRLINSLDNFPYTPTARQMLVNALTAHTAAVSDLFGTSLDDANRHLLNGVMAVCTQQQAEAGGLACYSNLNRLVSEHNGEADQVRSTLQWLGVVPEPVVDIFAPENSLRVKFDLGNEQARCNAWYQEMAQNGCN